MPHAAQPAVDIHARDPPKVFRNHVSLQASNDGIEVRRKILRVHEHRGSLDHKFSRIREIPRIAPLGAFR